MCYAVNLGDSRAILSEKGGKKVVDLSYDVKNYLIYKKKYKLIKI